MKILFCIQLMIEMDHPWLYTNYLTNYFQKYIEELQQVNGQFEAAILMGEAPHMIYQEIPGVKKYVVTQKQMTCNGIHSHTKILREYFRYCHERINEPEFMEYHVKLIRKIVDFKPDIIISRDNAPYLEKCFSDALMLYTEVGFVSRKPFQQTMYFDILGMNCGSYLYKYWSKVEPQILWNNQNRQKIQELKSAVTSCIMNHNPYTGIVHSWRERFDKLYILPMQFSGFSNIDAEIGFDSQFDVLIYVFDRVPSDIGVVVTTHPDYNVLNKGTLKFLRKKYSNFLYSETFLLYNASSQYLLGLMDGVINLSSTIGLQTLFWDIPCLTIGKYFANYISKPFSEYSEYKGLSENEIERNNKVLFWLLTHYIITPQYLYDGKSLNCILSNLLKQYKNGKLDEIYQPFESPWKILDDMISNLNEDIPEPRGNLENMVDEKLLLNSEKRKKIIVFGTGAVYQRMKNYLSETLIVAFLDNDYRKQGTVLDGARIISPIEVINYKYDAIFLLSDSYADMRKQLLNYGVVADKMYAANELGRWLYNTSDRAEMNKSYKAIMKKITDEKKKTVVLVSNRMDLTGAAIVLYYAALIFKKNGFCVIVCSTLRGKLEQFYEQEKIPFLLDPALNRYNKEFWNLVDRSDCLLINTLLEKELIYGVKRTHTKCIWWVHESGDRCLEVNNRELVNAFRPNLSIYGVGKRVIDTLTNLEMWVKVPVNNLIFGIPDQAEFRSYGHLADKKKIINICLIGSIYPVKGQDIFAEAINLLPKPLQKKCTFSIVGNILLNDYFDDVMKRCPHLQYLGEMNRNDILNLYTDMDILVCPSRRDSLPAVTIEAMMYGKVIIASNCIGTAEYIDDNINGIIFETENAYQLAEKLTYVIEKYDSLDAMRKAARKTYEQNFSMEIFEKNLKKMILEELNLEEI